MILILIEIRYVYLLPIFRSLHFLLDLHPYIIHNLIPKKILQIYFRYFPDG